MEYNFCNCDGPITLFGPIEETNRDDLGNATIIARSIVGEIPAGETFLILSNDAHLTKILWKDKVGIALTIGLDLKILEK